MVTRSVFLRGTTLSSRPARLYSMRLFGGSFQNLAIKAAKSRVAASRIATTIAVIHRETAIGNSKTKALRRDLFHDFGDIKRLNKRRPAIFFMMPSFRWAIGRCFAAFCYVTSNCMMQVTDRWFGLPPSSNIWPIQSYVIGKLHRLKLYVRWHGKPNNVIKNQIYTLMPVIGKDGFSDN